MTVKVVLPCQDSTEFVCTCVTWGLSILDRVPVLITMALLVRRVQSLRISIVHST